MIRARFFSLISLWSRPLRPGIVMMRLSYTSLARADPNFHFQFFRLRLHHRAAFFNIGSNNVAAERNHRRVANNAFVEDRNISGTATDVHQSHARLLFLVGQRSIGTGDGFQSKISHFQARLFDAAENVIDRRNLPGDNVEIRFQTNAAHPDRVSNALLAIHRKFLREYVDNFVAGWQHEFEHIIDDAVNVAASNLRVGRFRGSKCPGVAGF